MKIADKILISIVLLLGLAHTGLTPCFYKEFNEACIWFAGTGLSFIFLSFLNVARLVSKSSLVGYLCVFSNILTLLLVTALFFASSTVEATGFVSLISLILISITSLVYTRKKGMV